MRKAVTLSISVDSSQFADLQREFDLYKYGVQEALHDATQDTIRDLRGAFGNLLAHELKISASVLKNRIQLRYGYRSGTGRVWFGISPISLCDLGAKQTATGVDASPMSVAHAFISDKLHGQVFVRAGKDRLPLVKQVYDIEEISRDVIVNRVFPIVRSTFMANVRTRLENSFAQRR